MGETRGAFLCDPPPADICFRKIVKKHYEIFVHIRKPPPPLVSDLGETRGGAFLLISGIALMTKTEGEVGYWWCDSSAIIIRTMNVVSVFCVSVGAM